MQQVQILADSLRFTRENYKGDSKGRVPREISKGGFTGEIQGRYPRVQGR